MDIYKVDEEFFSTIIAPQLATLILVSSKDLTIREISEDYKTITLSDGVEYYLGETNSWGATYWPEDMQHDYDIVAIEIDDEIDGVTTWRMWHGS
jgi:hypothetical protein